MGMDNFIGKPVSIDSLRTGLIEAHESLYGYRSPGPSQTQSPDVAKLHTGNGSSNGNGHGTPRSPGASGPASGPAVLAASAAATSTAAAGASAAAPGSVAASGSASASASSSAVSISIPMPLPSPSKRASLASSLPPIQQNRQASDSTKATIRALTTPPMHRIPVLEEA